MTICTFKYYPPCNLPVVFTSFPCRRSIKTYVRVYLFHALFELLLLSLYAAACTHLWPPFYVSNHTLLNTARLVSSIHLPLPKKTAKTLFFFSIKTHILNINTRSTLGRAVTKQITCNTPVDWIANTL